MSSNFDNLHPRVDIRKYELGEELPEFDCGKSWFNDFINTSEVEEYQRKQLGRTWLVYLDGEFAAYFCLSPNSMTQDDYDPENAAGARGLYDGPFDMPARLLGHLAVDEQFKNDGLGEYLLKHVIVRTEETDTPYRVIILHSHADVIEFYQKYGFAEAYPQQTTNSGTILMFYDLGRISGES